MSKFGAAILGVQGTELGDKERSFFKEANPFGFILFGRNLETATQIRALTTELRSCVGHDVPILIDQEGGRVQRLRPPLAREWLPPLDEVARLGRHATRGMYLRYAIIGHELMSYGIDADCAPMLDIARPSTHAFLHNRCYADTLERVVEIGHAVVTGLESAGVYPILKHMPGHGLAKIDSHKDVPRITAPRGLLETEDFAAFKAFSTMAMGMTAHLSFEDIDPTPATISPTMIQLIRDQIGFEGLLMTDDIGMDALPGTIPERSNAAIAAGCDIVLSCNSDLDEMIRVMEQVGPLSDAAQTRADAALAARPKPMDLDIDALTAEFEALG